MNFKCIAQSGIAIVMNDYKTSRVLHAKMAAAFLALFTALRRGKWADSVEVSQSRKYCVRTATDVMEGAVDMVGEVP